jgi:hypothetical protein
VSRQNESVKKLEVLVSRIPQLNEKLHSVIEVLGKRLVLVSKPQEKKLNDLFLQETLRHCAMM